MDVNEKVAQLKDPRNWHRYIAHESQNSAIGLTCPAFQKYIVHNPSGAIACNSMLTTFELAVIFMLAKDYYTGEGEIIDAGPLMGVTTNVFSRGLLANTEVMNNRKRVYAFDQFLLDGYNHFIDKKEASITGSFFDKFLEINRDYFSQIVVSPGDFLKMDWNDKLVEICFIDIAKGWELNDHIVKLFFPNLIPGQSILVQQDYVHFGEPWIHILMELYADYFELLYYVFGASAIYRYIKKIPDELIHINLKDLSLNEKETLYLRAMAKAPPSVREVMKAGFANLMIMENAFDKAEDALMTVDICRFTTDPTQDFSSIAKSNYRVMLDKLQKAKADRQPNRVYNSAP